MVAKADANEPAEDEDTELVDSGNAVKVRFFVGISDTMQCGLRLCHEKRCSVLTSVSHQSCRSWLLC